MKLVLICALLSSCCAVALSIPYNDMDDYVYATCHMEPNKDGSAAYNVTGDIYFRQMIKGKDSRFVEYKVNFEGFNSTDGVILHGFHVHMYGDVSQACGDAGGHFNPLGVDHGSKSKNKKFRHVGDLGNLEEDGNGKVSFSSIDRVISLRKSGRSILGRALMVHAGEDDLGLVDNEGSKKTGNAGGRLACCTIAASNANAWIEK